MLIARLARRVAKLQKNIIWCRSIKSNVCYSSSSQDPPQGPNRNDDEAIVDGATLELLQHLSLVNFGNDAAIARLEAAVRFANQLLEVDTAHVQPLYTVQEDRPLYLRDDVRSAVNCRDDLLKLATKTREEYFIAPSGNIPMKFNDGQSGGEK